jgi:hypothetical protein
VNGDIRKALEENVSIPVPLAGKVFGLGRNGAYDAVKRGDIPSVKIGGRIVVPTAPLRRMLGMDVREVA